MGRMTSAERMHAVMMGQKPDRVPVNPFAMGYCMQIVGLPLGDFYSDGKKSFYGQFMSMRLHGYDVSPMYGYASCGPWEMGGEIAFPYGPGHSAPSVTRHAVNTIEDAENLEVPEFRDGKLPGAYGIADDLFQMCAKYKMPVTFQSGSTFTASSVVADTTLFLKWVLKEPKTLHMLLDKVSDMYCNAIEYFADKYGPQAVMPFDGGPSEANTILSPKGFEEFAFPYMQKLHKKIADEGIGVVLMHPCADQNMNIPFYIKVREQMNWRGKYIWLFGPETPVQDQIDAFGAHDVICGNVDPPSFQTKPYEECVELCQKNIEEGKDSPSGFILAPGCEFPPGASPDKLMAMMDAAEQFGRYE